MTLTEIPRIPSIDYIMVIVMYVVWYILANMYHLAVHGSTEYLTPVVTSKHTANPLKNLEETVMADLKAENTKLKTQMLTQENAMLKAQLV